MWMLYVCSIYVPSFSVYSSIWMWVQSATEPTRCVCAQRQNMRWTKTRASNATTIEHNTMSLLISLLSTLQSTKTCSAVLLEWMSHFNYSQFFDEQIQHLFAEVWWQIYSSFGKSEWKPPIKRVRSVLFFHLSVRGVDFLLKKKWIFLGGKTLVLVWNDDLLIFFSRFFFSVVHDVTNYLGHTIKKLNGEGVETQYDKKFIHVFFFRVSSILNLCW